MLIINLVNLPAFGVSYDPLKVRISPAPKDIVEERSSVIIGVVAELKLNLQLEAVQVPSSETR